MRIEPSIRNYLISSIKERDVSSFSFVLLQNTEQEYNTYTMKSLILAQDER